MEKYDYNYEEPVKEKSVYLVHLDNARIVIVSSVFIAIIALSFLIGMNFSDSSDTTLFSGIDNQNVSRSYASFDNNEMNSLLEEDESEDSLDSFDKRLTQEDDTLSPDTIESPAAVHEPEKNKQQESQRRTTSRSQQSSSKPRQEKQESQPTSDVIAASATQENRRAVEDVIAERESQSGFSIQIASFDSQQKAVKTSDVINQENYNSFIAQANVNGNTYYRVKIGPFADRQEAFTTLETLHNTTRYTDSYITFEK